MIQYKCDLCGEVKNKKDIHIIEQFPRITSMPVKSPIGRTITVMHKIDFAETHLCPNCCEIIANMLPIVEAD